MPQTHDLIVNLPQDAGQAIWAFNPSGHVLIFVHGFMGCPTKTWRDFHSLMPQQAAAAGCDLIFYRYDGTHRRTNQSAVGLRKFLETLFTQPLTVINSSLSKKDARPAGSRFTRFTLVAHSIGAIVSRDALLQGYRGGSPWAPLTELVLFAPAHMGVVTVKLAQEIAPLSSIWSIFRGLQSLGWYQALLDVEENCQTLKHLRCGTRDMLTNNAAPTLVAKKVILAENDIVINSTQFCGDPPAELIRGKRHKNVCKPSPNFSEPVNTVLSIC